MTRRWMALPWFLTLALVLGFLGRGLVPTPQPARSEADIAPVEAIPTEPLTASEPSCKPSVPLQIALLPSPTGQGDRWILRLQSLDMDRDAVLRMGSGAEAEMQVLWRGRLTAGREETIEVQFGPTGSGAAVWAVLEASGLGDAAMRAVARAARPGATDDQLASETSAVLRNPATGEEVIQYTGRVEAER